MLVGEGSVMVYREGDWFLVCKLLQHEQNRAFLARCYWPVAELPTVENWRLADLRTSCETIVLPENAVVLTSEVVTDADREAMAAYQRIRAGIEQRKTQWKLLLEQAEEHFRQQQFDAAIARCTECASFVKYEPRVFQLRGKALLQSGRYSEAAADLEHALTLVPDDADTLCSCALAYFHQGKTANARTKAEALTEQQRTTPSCELLLQLLPVR